MEFPAGPGIARRSLLSLPFLHLAASAKTNGEYRFEHENVLGTSLELIVSTPSKKDAAAVEKKVLDEIDRLAKILSTYDDRSEIRRVEQFGGPRSSELSNVLNAYADWDHRTAGAISLRPHKNVGWNVDALGKAYILEMAKSAAGAPLLVNIGGDIVTSGAWPVSIADPMRPHENAPPLAQMVVTGESVATSGISERGRHIHDPRTGLPAKGAISATVIARDCVTANALSTALCVMDAEQGLRLVESSNAHALIVTEDGTVRRTTGFAHYERVPKFKKVMASGWPAGYQVSISLTLKSPNMIRARRPYVAIWAEDAKGKLIRNIDVWASRPRWFPELEEWWKINGRSSNVSSITRPTRDPGKYRLVWNGLDDNGQPVPPGTYQIFVETNRQHGNYYKRNGSILCGPKPSSASLSETPEFGTVTIEYGPPGPAA